MAISLTQQSTTADGSANLTLTTTALGSPTSTGDCIVAVVESFTSGGEFASSITDNNSNTWPGSAAVRVQDLNAGGRTVELWVLQNAPAKTGYTATVHYAAGTTETRLTVLDWAGVALSGAVDVTGTAATANGGANVNTLAVATSGSITNGGDVLITVFGAATAQAASAITVPTGTTQIEIDQNDATSIACGSAYKVLSGASGIQTLTWNWAAGGATNSTAAIILALMPQTPATYQPLITAFKQPFVDASGSEGGPGPMPSLFSFRGFPGVARQIASMQSPVPRPLYS